VATRSLSGRAPAKINLILDILGKREDGYHKLRTVLQTLGLADEVTVSLGTGTGMAISGPCAEHVPVDSSNLAWRAAEALAVLTGLSTAGLRIHIEKHIPAARGLGGGSSDAATVLRLLQRAWPGVTENLLTEAAISVGSDEAFFLVGGTALAEGRGERVTPLIQLPPHDVVLFIPRQTFEQKTAKLFQAVAECPYDTGEHSEMFLRAHPRPVRTAELHNGFERVLNTFSGLDELAREIESRTGERPRLAGAGPTLFWIGEPGHGPPIAAAASGIECEVVTTTTAGPTWAP
jgi:4-diphosphocytidyl-2-C-methyl-D-erythritol kinase